MHSALESEKKLCVTISVVAKLVRAIIKNIAVTPSEKRGKLFYLS